MSEERIWLDVPYAEKDDAKAAGARWDPAAKRWYAPRVGMASLVGWAAAARIPELLPGEDRSFGSGLFVDLVPSSCWFTNVRSCVTPRDWERLRRMLTHRAGQLCEICGRPEERMTRRWLEAHERWHYDPATLTQSLRRLICLCSDCHLSTHYGYAQVTGRDADALAHLRAVTGMTPEQAATHIRDAFEVWRHRSSREWTLDLGMLTRAGVTLTPPPGPSSRRGEAARQLRRPV